MTEFLSKIKPLIAREEFILALVFGTFLFGIYLYRKLKFPLLQPLLISTIIIIVFIETTGIGYETFHAQTRVLNFMLGPCVVALGYVLYEQIEHVKGNVLPIIIAVFAGAIVGIVSVILIAKAFGAEDLLIYSLAPKSVTIPIAMSIADKTGGTPSLAAAFVVICGVFGGLVGPVVLRKIGIKSKIAQGLAMGSASHAMGTARALEIGALEGAISGLAIGIMGVMTAILVPLIEIILM